ncbi:MAG: FecR family protein [Elusimicrobiota bacterium]
MKKIFLSVLCLFVLTGNVFSNAVVSRFRGNVSVFLNRLDKWQAAEKGVILSAKDKIKTSPDSRAELVFEDGSSVWIRENTELHVALIDSKQRAVTIPLGRVRIKISPLAGKRRFTAKTPTCTAAVRGTEFILTASETESQLLVLSGKIDFSNIMSQVSSEITEGQAATGLSTGELSPPRDFTQDELQMINDPSWQEFTEAGQESGEPQKAKETKEELSALRRELANIVQNMKTDIILNREYMDEIREADISTGRTLRDAFGNLVRVEQFLLRPDQNTVQFMNLTKRQEYVYKGYFAYSGPATSRIDSFDARIRFNMAMPNDIADWPSYVSVYKDSLRPEMISVKMSNGSDWTETVSNSKEVIGTDGEKKYEWDAVVKYVSSTQGEWLLDKSEYNDGDSGWYDTGDGVVTGSDDSFWMWAVSPKFRLYQEKGADGKYTPGTDTAKYVHLGTEFYGITNAGSVLTPANFVGTETNPFAVLKQIAFQNTMFCRVSDATSILLSEDTSSSDITPELKESVRNEFNKMTSFFGKGNIDLVWTLDIFIPTAQKLITQLDKLNSSETN